MREKSSLFLCFLFFSVSSSREPLPFPRPFLSFSLLFFAQFFKKRLLVPSENLSLSLSDKNEKKIGRKEVKKKTKRIFKNPAFLSLSLFFSRVSFFPCFPPIKNNPSRISTPPSFSTRQTCTRSTATSGRRRRSPKARGRSFRSRRATCPSRPSSCTCASSCRPCGPGARGPRSRR